MLKTLLSYAAVAFAVQMVTGVLTKIAEFVVAETISKEGFGTYGHFMLVLEVSAGFFIIGIDHALITYINKDRANYGRFLRLFMTYASAVIVIGLTVGLIMRPRLEAATWLALVMVGPYVLAELGKLVFRSRLEKRREFGFILVQSMTWSLGCLATIRLYPENLVPVAWGIGAILLVAVPVYVLFWRAARAETGKGAFALRPFGSGYEDFWGPYRPLWVAGLAFHGNNHVVRLVVDGHLGREELATWNFVFIMMMFIQKPLQLVQRATLPIFSRQSEDVPQGFRHLVRINLIVFPLIAIGVLAIYPLVLSFGSLGEKYGDTWIYLAIVIGASPVTAVEFLVATLAMAKGFPRSNRNAHVFTLLFNVPASWLLITKLGLLGAALSVGLYVLFFAGTMFYFARRHLPEYVAFALRHLVSSLLCLTAAIAVLGVTERPLWFAPVSVGIYLGGTRVLGLWEGHHVRVAWASVRELMSRIRRR